MAGIRLMWKVNSVADGQCVYRTIDDGGSGLYEIVQSYFRKVGDGWGEDRKWTASGSGTDEYYCEHHMWGGDPFLGLLEEYGYAPVKVIEGWEAMPEGTLGSLAVGEYGFGDNDSLGFNTVYVRLSDGADPMDKDADYLIYTSRPFPEPLALLDADLGYYTDMDFDPVEGDGKELHYKVAAFKGDVYKFSDQYHVVIGGTLYDPTYMRENLVLWLDAADSGTITEDGGEVSAWEDKSWESNHAEQASEARRPIYDEDGWDGTLPCIVFDGTRFLTIPHKDTLMCKSFLHIFIVVYWTIAQLNAGPIGRWDSADDWKIWRADTGITQGHVGGVTRTNQNNYTDGGDLDSGKYLFAMSIESENTVFFVNGEQKDVSAKEGLYGNPNTTMGIGSTAGLFPAFVGKIAEVVIVSGTEYLDEFTRHQMEGYLAHKWGLEGSLPEDHPFKASSPRV